MSQLPHFKFPASSSLANELPIANPSSSSTLQPPSHIHSHSHSHTRSTTTHLAPPTATAMATTPQSRRGSAAAGAPAEVSSPFNFSPQPLSASPVCSGVGQRRGHRYKHSSISANIFADPPPRAPPVLPASLPLPTFTEARQSMSAHQRLRLIWSLCHVLLSAYVFLSAEGSLAILALAHLVFFDAGSAAVCVVVDVLGNFEVWRRSTVRYPFGLQRVEVLAGFAMSVFLVFGGFDLVSHNVKHYLEDARHAHAHVDAVSDRLETTTIAGINIEASGIPSAAAAAHSHSHAAEISLVAPLTAILSTFISAYGLRNHHRIAKTLQIPYLRLPLLPALLSNPFHSLTLLVSQLLLIIPHVAPRHSLAVLDPLLCAVTALAMFLLGLHLATTQALMLLQSYPSPTTSLLSSSSSSTSEPPSFYASVPFVLREIESESEVDKVEDAQFWQVHYNLGLANLRIRLAKGTEESAVGRLRMRVGNLIQNRLGDGYGQGAGGSGGLRWEVTMETAAGN